MAFVTVAVVGAIFSNRIGTLCSSDKAVANVSERVELKTLSWYEISSKFIPITTSLFVSDT